MAGSTKFEITRRATFGLTIGAVSALRMRSGFAQDATPVPVDLALVKSYLTTETNEMKKGTEGLRAIAGRYYDLLVATEFDYQAALDANNLEIPGLVAAAKEEWVNASTRYERSEGLVAGVPSLAHFDVLIDAGPSGAEDPEGALDWTLELPNGEKLEKPGNYMGHLTEPTIWGTNKEFVGLEVDIDGDGDVELGDVLPEANIFKAAADGLDDATAEMQTAIAEWEPTIEDAFTALVVMIPTMGDYFEQWKLSRFVTGETSSEIAFVAVSRLLDVSGIVNGLDVTYDVLRPLVADVDPALDTQIDDGFADLVSFVNDLYQQELDGKAFTPDEAELFGTEAQEKAATLVGYVSQAVGLLNLAI